MLTLAQLTGELVVLATFQVTVAVCPSVQEEAVFCDVTVKGPMPATVVTVMFLSWVHPAIE